MRARVPIVALLLVGVWVAPADARTFVSARFEIPTVAEQEIGVDAYGNRIFISATKSDDDGLRFDSAEYNVRGAIRPRRIVGDFGRFGSLRLRFEPRDVRRFERSGCDVKQATGIFVGEASYAGEGVLAGASAHRVSGVVTVREGRRCRLAKRGRADRSQRATALTAIERNDNGGLATLFYALRMPQQAGTQFFAQRFGTEGRVSVSRLVLLAGRTRDFSFNEDLTDGSVTPPQPFAGTASYTRSDEGRMWGGDLTVGLLGLDPVSLTDPGIRADLRRIPVASIASRPVAHLGQLARYAGKYAPASRPPLSFP